MHSARVFGHQFESCSLVAVMQLWLQELGKQILQAFQEWNTRYSSSSVKFAMDAGNMSGFEATDENDSDGSDDDPCRGRA